MDLRQSTGGVRKVQSRSRGQKTSNPQLFDDTSMQQQNMYGYQPQGQQDYGMANPTQQPYYAADNQIYGGPQQAAANSMPFPGQQIFNDPMASMAMQYGQSLAGQGTQFLNKNIESYVSTSNLKYYFAVDTLYVGKKLGLILFPFAHSDWSPKFDPNQPIAPKDDVNAPDLYIPVMAFVTYTLLAGIILGTQNRFSPEQLGMTASTALVWSIMELLVLFISMYVLNISTRSNCFRYLHLLSYCGYKYVGMIVILCSSLLFQSVGYYAALAWMSLTTCIFLVKTMQLAIQPVSEPGTFEQDAELGNKRRLYMLLVVAIAQPLLMWWLTRSLAVSE